MMVEVVAALIWDDERFMICQRPEHKARGLLWEFAGGKVEPGETKEQALIRECREELAVTLSVGTEFMEVVHEYPDITAADAVQRRYCRGRAPEAGAQRHPLDHARGDPTV